MNDGEVILENLGYLVLNFKKILKTGELNKRKFPHKETSSEKNIFIKDRNISC